MLDDELKIPKDSKVGLVSIQCPSFPNHKTEKEVNNSLIELRELLRTLRLETGSDFVQIKKAPEAATILGSGKLKEISEKAKSEDIDLLVFDFELTAGQIRNIRKITSLKVVDRCHIILEIFAEHARTREAKIQIEISRLEYLLPRLSGFWTHLSRQRGGIGVKGGEGEQQIELDRRIVRQRLSHFKSELESIVKSRKEQRKKRKNKAITAALVGYTNAGKSSIMNRLCNTDLLEEDMLFATLDSTYRTLTPDTKPPMIMIDTVGLISNLPNTLIDGFKTTLESAIEADLLVIVCDISDPNFENHLAVTNSVLEELDIKDKDKLIVFNKKDKLSNQVKAKIAMKRYPRSFLVSSFSTKDMENLKTNIIDYFLSKQKHYDLFVPYQYGEVHSQIKSQTNIIGEASHEKGIFYRIKVPDFIFNRLNINKYLLSSPIDDKLLFFR